MILGIFVALIALFVILPIIGVALWWVITTAVSGLVLGALGRLVVPGQQPIGIVATIVCGWAGSLIGGLIGYGIWGIHHHHHWFATLLIEIAISAGAVALWSGRSRRAVGGSRSHRIIDV